MSEITAEYPIYSQENVKDKRILIVLNGEMNIDWDKYDMNWYVTEFDTISWDMFCYANNATDSFCSEWGYTNLKELMQYNCIKTYLSFTWKKVRASQLLKNL